VGGNASDIAIANGRNGRDPRVEADIATECASKRGYEARECRDQSVIAVAEA